MDRHARRIAAAAIVVAASCNVYDTSLLVGGGTGATGATGGSSKAGASGRGGSGMSGGSAGTSPDAGRGGTSVAGTGVGGVAGGGTAGRPSAGTSSGGRTQGGTSGSGGTDILGGAAGDGGEAGIMDAGSGGGGGTAGQGAGGMGGTAGKGGGGMGGTAGKGGGGMGGTAGKGGTGGAGAGGAGAGGKAGSGGSGGSGTVGCAKLSVGLNDDADKAHFVISLASPYANMSAAGSTISMRVYVEAGTGGSIFPYVQDSGTFHFLGMPNETLFASNTGTWLTINWDVAAADVGSTQLVKTSIQRIGIEVASLPTTGGPWTNPTVIYVDSITVNTPALSFPFTTTSTVTSTGATSDVSGQVMWLNTGTSDTTASPTTLTWVATCP